MIDPEDITITVAYYDKETTKKKYVPKFSIVSTFRYLGYDFYVARVSDEYKICVETNGSELLSVWSRPNDCTEFEIKSRFQRGLTTNNIGKKEIELFVSSPSEYKKQTRQNF